MTPAAVAKRNRTRILIAFAAVYVLWGSTYLAIKYAVASFPPFVMGATRFFVAGLALYAFARWRGQPAPNRTEWRNAAMTGVLMLAFGNGAVIWSEQTVPSGIVAIIVATVPLWMVLMDWLRPRGVRPKRMMFVGLALGLIGIAILIGAGSRGHVPPAGALVLMVGSISWAIGSILTRHTERPRSAFVYSALQMLAASAAFTIMAFASGELRAFSVDRVTLGGIAGWVYLIIFGSLIGYTAYIYLLGAVSAAKAATYAYVNPVIAVLLGWAFAHEPIGPRTLVAAAIILAGVAIITATQGSPAQVTGEHPVPTTTGVMKRSAA
jgi:drug/metabolite transporter (DMT)-like permease